MQRTYSDTPEPRYVERAKNVDNLPDVTKEHDSIKGIYAVDGGFAIDYKNGTTFHVPLEGTEDIIVDVDETNKMINIHLDATVRAKLAKVLTLPAQAPAATEFVGVSTNNAQKLMDATEARNALEVKKQVVLTATEYAAITTKDPNTLYLIVG